LPCSFRQGDWQNCAIPWSVSGI